MSDGFVELSEYLRARDRSLAELARGAELPLSLVCRHELRHYGDRCPDCDPRPAEVSRE